jgi:predicted nucleic acid-binding Zn ribbon protein
MNKQDIIRRLTDTQLDTHERESLSQLLHYLHAEGVNNTSSNNTRSHKRSSSSSNKSNKHTSSNKHTR